MDRVNWERRSLLLAVELGRNKRHPVGPRVTRQRDVEVSRGQPGLTGPQTERGQEGEVEALTPGSPEGSAQVTCTHCFWQACLLVGAQAASMVLTVVFSHTHAHTDGGGTPNSGHGVLLFSCSL